MAGFHAQPMIAAFTFGIVANAASVVLFLYTKIRRHVFARGGSRLALASFSIMSALWALTSFVATLLDTGSTRSCQVVILFAVLFDQLARFSLMQALIWEVNIHIKLSSIENLATQGILILRFVIGSIFVGFQRPQVDTVCVTLTSLLPLGICIFLMDTLAVAGLLARLILTKSSKDEPRTRWKRTMLLVIVGLGVWTIASASMVLASRSTILTVRTTIPAAGLTLLLGFLVISADKAVLYGDGFDFPLPPKSVHPTRELRSRDEFSVNTSYPPNPNVGLETTGQAFNIVPKVSITSEGSTSRLPMIARPFAGQAVTGMGGLPVQGQLFPPMRPEHTPAFPGTMRIARTKSKGKGLVISNPILKQTDEQNLLQKIPTIDLATAAMYQRAKGAHVHSTSAGSKVEDARMLSMSETIVQRNTLSKFEPTSLAKSTSTQLSPGVEEIRRRSPGQAPKEFDQSPSPAKVYSIPRASSEELQANHIDLTTLSEESPAAIGVPEIARSSSLGKTALRSTSGLQAKESNSNNDRVTALRKSILPRNTSVKHDIRPSRALQISSSSPETARLGTAAPRAPGLPRNPRIAATRTRRHDEEMMPGYGIASYKISKEQHGFGDFATHGTNLQYDGNTGNSLMRTTSMVHRPRPIPRKPKVNRSISLPKRATKAHHDQKEPSWNRKMDSDDGLASMNEHSSLKRVNQPTLNRSKSLSTRRKAKPRSQAAHFSSVDIKNPSWKSESAFETRLIPIAYLEQDIGSASESAPDAGLQISRENLAKNTGAGTIRDDQQQPARTYDGQVSKLSVLTAPSTAGEWKQQSSRPIPNREPSGTSIKRRSSPVLPADDLNYSSDEENHDGRTSLDERTFDLAFNADTNINTDANPKASPKVDPIPSPTLESTPNINIEPNANPNASFRNKSSLAAFDVEDVRILENPVKHALGKSPRVEYETDLADNTVKMEKDEETMTVMLDLSTRAELEPGLDLEGRDLSRLHDTEARGRQWHHRVGDVCPSFSERRKTARLRKIPPPTPLLLSRPSQTRVIQAEPSPLESPHHVLEVIQEQLRQFEAGDTDARTSEQHRLTLLAHLEMEVGEQESQWKQMRHTLISRDSLSTVEASPRLDPLNDNGRHLAVVQSGEQLLNTLSLGDETSRPQSPHSQLRDRLSSVTSWALNNNHNTVQQKLDNTKRGHGEPTPVVPFHIRDTMGYLTVPTSTFPMGSPTPPSTDASDNEYDKLEAMSQIKVKTDVGSIGLWRAVASDTLGVGMTRAFLWTPSNQARVQRQDIDLDLVETPSRAIRRQAEKDLEPLQIESSQLWKKVKPIASEQRSSWLWQSATHFQKIDPDQGAEKMVLRAPRPVTQRPARRNKRVTVLPDILENPKPLPDKRGTLGIFVFPGGGVSDIATVQPRSQMLRLQHMPGTMTSGGVPITSATIDAPAPAPVSVPAGPGRSQTPKPEPAPAPAPAPSSTPTFGHGVPSANAFPASFFDDCDKANYGSHAEDTEDGDTDTTDIDDDDDDNCEYYSFEENDGFDETTIWEIASLLRFNNFPARDSHDSVLFPTSNEEPHQNYQQSGQLGNSSGHGDSLDPVNAGPGLPTDDELAEMHVGEKVFVSVTDSDRVSDRETWKCRGSHGDYQDCCCANPSVLEITNGFPSPPLRSAPSRANDDEYHHQAKVALSPCQTCQGNLSKGLQKGTFPEPGEAAEVPETGTKTGLLAGTPTASTGLEGSLMQFDGRMQRTYLNLASATDTSRRRKRKAELVEGVVPILQSVSISNADRQAFCICTPAPMPLNRVAPSAPPPVADACQTCSVGLEQRQSVELLWNPSPVETPPAKGLAQPDDQVWRIYLSISTSTQDTRRIQNQRLDLPTISSSSLWSLQQSKDDFCHHSQQACNALWNHSTSSISTLISTPSSTNSMALWSPTAPLPVFHKGFAQPDSATWNSYVSRVSDAIRAVPRKSEPASIESNSLWTPSPKKAKIEVETQPQTGLWSSKSQKQSSNYGLWVQPPKVEKISYGLSQPEEHVWAAYVPAKEDGLRVKARPAIPATIESSQLWSPPPKTMIAESNEPLWSKPRIITISTDSSTTSSQPQKAVNVDNFGLWTAPVAIVEEEPQGLFSLSHKRSDYRSTSLEPAALHMQRRPRAALEPYADFVFAHLWNEAPLWRGPKPIVKEQAEGLFSLGHIRPTYRTTTEPPAGLDMIRKPRVSDEPLPKLTSNSLWSMPTMPSTAVEIDWLKLSTVGPKKAPSIASIISENESLTTEASIDTDASSVKSLILEDHLTQFDATPLQWDDDSSVAESTRTKSGLWAKPSNSKSTSSSQVASMWRPASPDAFDEEPEYLIGEPDEERSATFRYRRKSDEETLSKNMSPSNFLLLSDPEMPRDFSAQGLWSQLEEFAVEEKVWLDESKVRMTNRWLALC